MAAILFRSQYIKCYSDPFSMGELHWDDQGEQKAPILLLIFDLIELIQWKFCSAKLLSTNL